MCYIDHMLHYTMVPILSSDKAITPKCVPTDGPAVNPVTLNVLDNPRGVRALPQEWGSPAVK